uniref:Uncharacterized protein n=1 Tax=Ralstonia solanacearum TaxID=305 RepID=A0A0S4TM71_RALSL|nr:protein of unknown function [Ralstonia solanacearum]
MQRVPDTVLTTVETVRAEALSGGAALGCGGIGECRRRSSRVRPACDRMPGPPWRQPGTALRPGLRRPT